jgi:hypothetical protein
MTGHLKLGIAFLCGLFAATPFGIAAYAQSATTVQALDSRLTAVEQALAQSRAANAPVTTAKFDALSDRVTSLEKAALADEKSIANNAAASQKSVSDLQGKVDKYHVEFANHAHILDLGYVQVNQTRVVPAPPNGSLITSKPVPGP